MKVRIQISLKRLVRWVAVACLALTVSRTAPAARGADDERETKAAELATLPGFKVDVVMAADKARHSSWISMALDHQGRLLLAGQRKEPITRLTLFDGKVVKDEQLGIPLSECMGMLFAFDSLYINGYDEKTKKFGLFRCRDTQGGDEYTDIQMIREWPNGTGDHGGHAIVLSPDKKQLYVVCGNFVPVPEDLLPTSPHKNYADDMVLPRAEDGGTGALGNSPPGGFIVRMDPDGKIPRSSRRG